MNTDMVRATLEHRKTQTRRPIKPQPPDDILRLTQFCDEWRGYKNKPHDMDPIKSQYQVGGHLYVRETFSTGFALNGSDEFGNPINIIYRADDEYYNTTNYIGNWTPSIHMEKEFARIWLEVTEIRAQRIQDISENDCICEGIRKVSKDGNLNKYCIYDHSDYSSTPWTNMPRSAIKAYENLWNSTYAKRGHGWDNNPWVWVYGFKVISTNGR